MTFRVVIPARLGSTRLPGKALAAIGGKPMVVRVAERASDSGASEVWVATDSQQIVETVRGHGFKAVMTRSDHVSGTDRIAEVAARFGWPDDAVVVNVQGDEPLINPDLIGSVAALLPPGEAASMATAAYPIFRVQEFLDPNAVKVVLDRHGYAAYFSRAPIPWPRDAGLSGGDPAVLDGVLPRETQALRHVGLYAYRSAFLRSIPHLQPSPHETAESLEQLRVIWNGFRIRVVVTGQAPEPGVDTPEDLRRVRERFERS